MNYSIKNGKIICALLLLIFFGCNAAEQLKIQGHACSKIMAPRKFLFVEFTDPIDGVVVSCKEGSFDINVFELENAQELRDYCETLNRNFDVDGDVKCDDEVVLDFPHQVRGPVSNICASARTLLTIKNDTAVVLQDSIFTSKKVVFSGKKIDMKKCFFDAERFSMIPSEAPGTFFSRLEFVFDKQLDVPVVVQGTFDFEKNKADMIVLGARTVIFSLTPVAFGR